MGKEASKSGLVSVESVKQHAKLDDCWIVVDDKVWDLTEFAPKHPGGPGIILKHAGRDASESYNAIHSPSLLQSEIPDSFIGHLDTCTVTADWQKPPPTATKELPLSEKPPLSTIINTYDFETVARNTATKKTWAFYSSAATDLITRDANKSMFDRIWFRPRLLRDVKDVDTRVKILGKTSSLPFFASPAAMAKLVHPDGEKAIARACQAKGIFQAISTSASFSAPEIIDSLPPSNNTHPFLFQLYVHKDRARAAQLITQISRIPNIIGILLTIDAPVAGKREADERLSADETLHAPMSDVRARNDSQGGAYGRLMASYIDPSLTWSSTLSWLSSLTSLPLLLKGVQTAADALLAVKHGCKGLLLGNHGGRSLDTSPPSILILLDLQKNCPEVFDALEVFVDGGIRRGTDVVKALCLGATAVGLGRPVLYATGYGQEGVEHLVEVLRDEVEVTMRMIGARSVEELHPGLVNTGDVERLVPEGVQEEGHPFARRVRMARL